jgi:hypothetical protein
MILDLDQLDGKDWYQWGAEIVLKNQGGDGLWRGSYADGGADTCFALLFLKRSNLARDLSANLRGLVKDTRELRSGGLGVPKLPKRVALGIESTNEKKEGERPAANAKAGGESSNPAAGAPKAEARTQPALEGPSARLADELVKAPLAEREAVLKKLQESKGPEYTEALAGAIPQLEGEAKAQARDALSQRLARMKAETLAQYLKDDEPEIRRAAALACAMKELKDLAPQIVPLLRDREPGVAPAAHTALKHLTGQDFGKDATAWEEGLKKAG